MPTKLNFGRDLQGFNSYAPDFSDINFSATLTNGSEQTFTVPSDYQVWIAAFSFQPGTAVWVSRNHTATIPAGGTFLATNSYLLPGSRRVYAGDVLHFITDSAASDVSVALYAIS